MTTSKVNKKHITILTFGLLLAMLTAVLQFFEYRYFIGSLDTEIYTSIVATIFTAVGVWIGISILRKKSQKFDSQQAIDPKFLKELNLNSREFEILQLLSKGLSNQEIADKLFIALPTVKTHTSNLYLKLHVKSRTQAIHKAQSLKLI